MLRIILWFSAVSKTCFTQKLEDVYLESIGSGCLVIFKILELVRDRNAGYLVLFVYTTH